MLHIYTTPYAGGECGRAFSIQNTYGTVNLFQIHISTGSSEFIGGRIEGSFDI